MREFADCKIFINIEELGSLQSTHLPHPELVDGRTMGMELLRDPGRQTRQALLNRLKFKTAEKIR
jgi:hypothetical protein